MNTEIHIQFNKNKVFGLYKLYFIKKKILIPLAKKLFSLPWKTFFYLKHFPLLSPLVWENIGSNKKFVFELRKNYIFFIFLFPQWGEGGGTCPLKVESF